MIETLEQSEGNLRRERSGQAMKAFRRSVRPIYAVRAPGPNPLLVQVGSCILVNIDGQRVMSTAAHIFDELSANPLFVGGPPGTRPVPIEGGVLRTTRAPRGNRDQDHSDCAFWRIPEPALSALGDVDFVDSSRIANNRAPPDRRYYMAMGYAVSRNKGAIDRRTRSISNRLSRYSGSVVELPALATELRVSGADHLFLNFEKRALTEDGSPENAFRSIGFSGGALLDLGDFTVPSAYDRSHVWHPMLSGMLIEHREKHRVMVAVKIGLIVRGIERALGSVPSGNHL